MDKKLEDTIAVQVIFFYYSTVFSSLLLLYISCYAN